MAAMSSSTPEVFRTPDSRFEKLPGYGFAPHYLEVDGLRMHYLDEGPRDGSPVVCFHGEPSWAYLYRKMLPPLVAAGHRVIVPDYAGFGRSDKPTDRGWYTYDRHCALVDQGAGALLTCSNATVAVQDWGGPIGLRWAVENAARVDALMIMNTGLFTGRVSKGFMAWRDIRRKEPGSARRLRDPERHDDPTSRRHRRRLRRAVSHRRVQGRRRPIPAAGAHQRGCGGRASRCSRSATRCRDGTSRHWSPFPTGTRYFRIRKAGQAFCDLIPTAGEQVRIEGAAHFLQEDRGEQLAEELLTRLAKV